MPSKITYEQANQRFINQGRTDIELCEDGYVGWKKKSKFYDRIEKDYFWSVPGKVFAEKIVHPNRRADKRKRTNLQKFGYDSASKSPEVKNKISRSHLNNFADPVKAEKIKNNRKDGCLKKYGVDNAMKDENILSKQQDSVEKHFGHKHPSQCDLVKNKTKQTNLKKYGFENPMQNKIIQKKLKLSINKKYGVDYTWQLDKIVEKSKKTSISKYGSKYPTSNITVKEKISKSHIKNNLNPKKVEFIKNKVKNTSQEKYGTDHPLQSSIVQEKIKATMKNKYGREHPSCLLQKYFITETKEPLSEWYKKEKRDKPSLVTIERYYQNINQTFISLNELENWILNYKENKTILETLGEELFDIRHYNRKPKKIIKLYRPDFKLSDTVYANVDGLYWHSELQKDKYYHFNMRKHFEEHNLRLIQFRENEIRDKPDICKSIIDNALNKNLNEIHAKECDVYIVTQDEANIFLKHNSLKGSTTSKHVGLYYNNQLISLLSYKKKKHICKIERYCSALNIRVTNSFSKLLSYLEENCCQHTTTEIHNWIDLRYEMGDFLLKNYFIPDEEKLDWKWTNCKMTMNKFNLFKLRQENKLNWIKIYDAGQKLYVKK